MSTRTVWVDVPRIGGWVSRFAGGHDGAMLGPLDEQRCVVRGGDGQTAVLHRWPGGPVLSEHVAIDADALLDLDSWTQVPRHLGVILIRRGGYAVGLSDGVELLSHKSGTAYVQSRTAAGGTSQQRFARRRGNQADALVGTVSDLAARHLLVPPVGTASHRPLGIILGGDRRLAEQVLQAAPLAPIQDLPRQVYPDLPDPRFAVLKTAVRRGHSIRVELGTSH